MSQRTKNPATDNRTAVDTDGIDKRKRKALTEDMFVANVNVDPLAPAADVYVQNEDSSTDDGVSLNRVTVNLHSTRVRGCTCEDTAYHQPDEGCKHERYVRAVLSVLLSLSEDSVERETIVTMTRISSSELERLERFLVLDEEEGDN